MDPEDAECCTERGTEFPDLARIKDISGLVFPLIAVAGIMAFAWFLL